MEQRSDRPRTIRNRNPRRKDRSATLKEKVGGYRSEFPIQYWEGIAWYGKSQNEIRCTPTGVKFSQAGANISYRKAWLVAWKHLRRLPTHGSLNADEQLPVARSGLERHGDGYITTPLHLVSHRARGMELERTLHCSPVVRILPPLAHPRPPPPTSSQELTGSNPFHSFVKSFSAFRRGSPSGGCPELFDS